MVVTANDDPAVSAAPVSGAQAARERPGAALAPVNGEAGPPVKAIAGTKVPVTGSRIATVPVTGSRIGRTVPVTGSRIGRTCR